MGKTRITAPEGAPGHVSLDTQALEDLGSGRTRIRSRSVFLSVADRDSLVESGMGSGVEDAYNRLDELLDQLRAPVSSGG